MHAAGRHWRGHVHARFQSQVLHVPTARQYAEGHRRAVQSDPERISPVPDDRGRLRVLLQEQAEREASALGHGRLPPLSEASGERLFEQPRLNPSTGYHELSWETFSLIMSGVSLESVRFRKRYRTRFAGM